MRISRLSVLLIILLFIAVAQPAHAHFQWEITDVNMSIIVMSVTLDGEPMVQGDEIGVFTEDGLCAGGDVVAADGRSGPTAMGAEGELDNGFQDREPIGFRVWDASAELEAPAQVGRILNGVPAIYVTNNMSVLTLVAESPPPEPSIWISEDMHDFGIIRAGRAVDWHFTVGNNGGEVLSVESMNLEGDHYTVNFDEAFDLDPDAEREFTVTFATQEEDEGEYNATITIVSNDPDGDVVIDLTGAARASVPPTIVLSRNNFAFGGVLVGNQATRTLTVSNAGEETLTIEDVALESEVFSINFEESFDLGFEESANLTITFDPQEFQQYQAEITITSNDPAHRESVVALTGEGLNPEDSGVIALEEVEVKEIQIGDEMVSMNFAPFFGYVVTGQQKTLRWTLLNNGGRDILIDRITIDDQDFTAALRPGGDRIRRGDRSYLDVTFAPRRDDFYENVHMTIFSNDPANAEFVLVLGGESGADRGLHFQCSLMEVNHSVLAQGLTLDGAALVQNDEVGAYTVAGLLAGNGVVDVRGQCGIALYGDGAETWITDGFANGEPFRFVVWDRDANVEAPAAFQNLNNGPETYITNGFTVVNLTARTGEPEPDFFVRRASHYFGQVDCNGGSADWVFRIENHGIGTLSIQSIESDDGAFTTDFTEPVDIGERGVLDVTVTFTPDQIAEYNARLTIVSNDPDDNPYYIDVTGDGAENPQNPGVEIVENHFFGVCHLNSPTSYILSINSVGGARLDITEIGYQGDQVFGSNWDGQNHVVNPGESYELTINFTPNEVRQFNGMFTIQTNAEQEPREFAVRGWGSDAADHFLELNTGASHSIRVVQSNIITRQDAVMTLFPGDEIGAFTDGGLCAGHGRCAAAGDTIAIAAFANDPNNDFADGFIPGEQFSFKIWDRSTGDELDCEVVFVNGPQVFTIGGNTEIRVTARALQEEGMLSVTPALLQMGAVRVGQRTTGVFHLENVGGANLTVQNIQSNRQVFTTNFANPVVLEPGGAADVTVTFAPAAALPYEGILTVNSNDPHRPGYQVRPCGMGSDVANNAHFVFGRTGANQSIIIQHILVGDQLPGIGDEVGIFTEAGFCAGSAIVTNPDSQLGPAAFGDDEETTFLIEGFHPNELMTLRYYYRGQDRETDEVQLDILQGNMNYVTNALTVIRTLTVAYEGVRIVPVNPFTIREKQNADFQIQLAHAEQGYNITFDNRGDYARIPENAFVVADNVGTFHWRTDSLSARVYDLVFSVRDGEQVLDRTTVHFTVLQVNEPPYVNREYLQGLIDQGEVNGHQLVREGETYVFRVPQHAGGNPAWVQVFNLRQMMPDIDGQQLVYYYNTNANQIPAAQIRQQKDNNDIYSISPMNNWAGRNTFFWVTANDQFGEEGGDERDRGIRDVRSVRNGFYPTRDDTMHFDFVVEVIDVPDAPVITAPAAGAQYQVNENAPMDQVRFVATDADADDQLRWEADINGELPEGYRFVDNGDRTATLDWTPTFDDAGVYNPVFRVSDPGGLNATVTIRITVANVNRPPIIDGPVAGRQYVGDENAELRIADFQAHDRDGGALTWDISARGGLPANAPLPNGPFIQQNNDGAATFIWIPTFTQAGNYNPTFRITDANNGTATVAISIVINNVNRPPRPGGRLADIVVNEDTVRTNINLAGSILDDDTGEQAQLVFALVNPLEELGLTIQGAMLNVRPIANFNTNDQNVVVEYSGTDPGGASVNQQVNVMVRPFNDPPAPFNLLTPENNFAIAYLDSSNAVNFTWEEAVQNQWEVDSVRYALVIWEETNPNITLRIMGIEGASYQNPAYSPIAIADSLNLWLGTPFWLNWRVEAIDRSPAALPAANAPFRFQIPQLSVRDDGFSSIPDHFFLSGNFPNPFNSETTVRYGLPVPALVSLTVWDMHGRQVAELQRGQIAAGQYEAVWNAAGLTSGIYFIRLQANSFITMNKAILVR